MRKNLKVRLNYKTTKNGVQRPIQTGASLYHHSEKKCTNKLVGNFDLDTHFHILDRSIRVKKLMFFVHPNFRIGLHRCHQTAIDPKKNKNN